ncbi:L-2-hydroxyisocaproate dehydrogenase [Apilactobacillus kunkeei]|uniref:L-lactate dehydrogenase n=1 Tax=Apilactobacillus TaxID=2767877 RepID=UPI0006C0487F|nr:L-lactate dehydrogenase [Apilactobacillus kunkeei]KOY74304.1 L-2-hydroxyisocaproate dehydrogenase [Apilactobacillus kunkeei]CAI2588243.1 L-2-hydroxyisocaproate dehydrogenase [Apilactobacillus kunkeei]CAI2590246.1 L-2-hydroxyisocaproate dehydrogenase [Apilactobacillus kunkeei]CAI2590724.1 L-2-hydroxyisocaproate dehydrogenase [Apilactobacillus kunkeei]
MTRKIGIIGDGNVGAAVAHHIVVSGIADDLVMIDHNDAKVNSDALDFRDAMSNLKFHTNIEVNNYASLADADVIISAVGHMELINANKDKHDRFAELTANVEEVKDVAKHIKESGFHGIIIVITNPNDVITSLYQRETGFAKERVIGTGTLLDSARMKRAVAAKLNIDPRSVIGYNLGEHGNSQFTAWSTVQVFDKSIFEYAEKYNIDLDEIDNDARMGGFTVHSGKGYTNFAISASAVKLAEIVLQDAKTELAVSNYREEYGTYLSYPAIVGRNGIEKQIDLDLPEKEQKQLQASADYINQKTREITD